MRERTRSTSSGELANDSATSLDAAADADRDCLAVRVDLHRQGGGGWTLTALLERTRPPSITTASASPSDRLTPLQHHARVDVPATDLRAMEVEAEGLGRYPLHDVDGRFHKVDGRMGEIDPEQVHAGLVEPPDLRRERCRAQSAENLDFHTAFYDVPPPCAAR
jgi:hypothetical protein